MKRLSKLLLGSCMLVATIISCVSATYAFVIINKEVEVEEMDFNLKTDTGLLISLDGQNFYQDITLNQIKNQILENTGVNYEDIKYSGVSLEHDSNGKVVYKNGIPNMQKDNLVEATTIENDIRYNHTLVDAANSDYIALDFYFRIVNQGDVTTTHELKFNNPTAITGTSTTVEIMNSLTTKEGIKNSGDSITVNPVDSLRLGVVNYNVNSFIVYEPTIGLGSAAIDGKLDDNHNPLKNAMYTYYNNLHPFEPFTKAAADGEGFNTLSTFTDNVLGEFVYDTNNAKYNDIKLTIIIWLEGWDADYFMGIPVSATKFSINLSFIMNEKQ